MSKKKSEFVTSRIERLSYGGFFVGQNIIYMIVLQFLTIFYTDELGLAPAAVGTLFLIARVWDAINDPMLGALVDRFNFKGGKFKPWINAATVLLPLATIAVFYNFNGSPTTNLIYAYITYILWGMIYTISDVPIFALATAMTDNLDERVSIISIGRVAAGIAGLVGGIVAAPVIASFGYTKATILLAAIALITMIPIRFFTKERVVYERKEKVTLRSMVEAVYRNKYLMIFYAAYIIMVGLNTASIVGVYFVTYNLGKFELYAITALAGMLPMLIVPILLPALVRRFGKKNTFLFSAAFGIVISLIQYFLGYDNFALYLAFTALKGFSLYTPMMMMGLFSADCAEYGAYVTGKRNEGITFSIQTFSSKLGTAFAGLVGTWLLGFFGYVANVEQTARALEGIWLMMTIIPLIGMVIGFIIIAVFYDLKESDVESMIKEMKDKESITNKEEF